MCYAGVSANCTGAAAGYGGAPAFFDRRGEGGDSVATELQRNTFNASANADSGTHSNRLTRLADALEHVATLRRSALRRPRQGGVAVRPRSKPIPKNRYAVYDRRLSIPHARSAVIDRRYSANARYLSPTTCPSVCWANKYGRP
jgi:hypothetical protein